MTPTPGAIVTNFATGNMETVAIQSDGTVLPGERASTFTHHGLPPSIFRRQRLPASAT